MMKLSDISYEATLQTADGVEYNRVPANYNGIHMTAMEMWASFYPDVYKCDIQFFNMGMDDELFKLGYAKVLKLEKVEIYEERTKVY